MNRKVNNLKNNRAVYFYILTGIVYVIGFIIVYVFDINFDPSKTISELVQTSVGVFIIWPIIFIIILLFLILANPVKSSYYYVYFISTLIPLISAFILYILLEKNIIPNPKIIQAKNLTTKRANEQKFRENQLKKLLQRFESITIDDFAQLMGFTNRIDLMKFLLDLPPSVLISVTENTIHFKKIDDEAVMDAQIATLSQLFAEWEERSKIK